MPIKRSRDRLASTKLDVKTLSGNGTRETGVQGGQRVWASVSGREEGVIALPRGHWQTQRVARAREPRSRDYAAVFRQ